MPEGKLFKPLLACGSSFRGKPGLEEFKAEKKLKKVAYIQEAIFLRLRQALSETALLQVLKNSPQEDGPGFEEHQQLHNRIDRLTGTTPAENGLYMETFRVPGKKTRLQVFMASKEEVYDRMITLFEYMGTAGFGANASTGKGTFKFGITREEKLFSQSGPRAMSLSHGVITENMAEPRYKLHTHFGKLGGHFAAGLYNPFKYPALMAEPGATFTPLAEPPYGQLLADVHHEPQLNFIKHHALHLPVFFTEAEP
jgi:CRISPR-associated protein Csm4